jgi:hypothetical protein
LNLSREKPVPPPRIRYELTFCGRRSKKILYITLSSTNSVYYIIFNKFCILHYLQQILYITLSLTNSVYYIIFNKFCILQYLQQILYITLSSTNFVYYIIFNKFCLLHYFQQIICRNVADAKLLVTIFNKLSAEIWQTQNC